jgi:glycosyltransferase involved in cell wall biosynthesis
VSRPLRVAIDVTQIDNQTLGSGQFRYAVDLVDGLSRDARAQITLIGSQPSPAGDFVPAVQRGVRYVCFPPQSGRGYYYRDLLRLSWWLRRERPDVLHELHTNIPPLAPCPVVVTVHHYFYDPALFATRPYRYYLWALRRAARIITVSDATKDDFAREFGIPRERMRTVHHGLSKSFEGPVAPVEGSYVLSPYNLSAPKNLVSLIDAWPAIAERHPSLELVLYGRAHVTPTREEAFDRRLAAVAHADRLRRTGVVSDRELSALFAGATLFVFPTLVEGFGYPLLEAMSHGVCSIARNASAMKEIGGDAVCLVETTRPEEIAGAALELLADPVRRSDFGARARARAATFTIERMVEQTLACYESVARAAPSDR